MPRFICQKDGVFFEYSTIVDAPVTGGMTEEQFRYYYKESYGDRPIDERIERAKKKGTSSLNDDSLENVIFHNRAGPDETSISLDEMMERLEK